MLVFTEDKRVYSRFLIGEVRGEIMLYLVRKKGVLEVGSRRGMVLISKGRDVLAFFCWRVGLF